MLKSYILNKKQIKDKLYEFKKSELFKKLKRYVATGLMSASIEYGLFRLFLDIFDIHYLVANAVVYFIVFWFGFLMYKFWAFKAAGNIRRQLLLYLALFLFNMGAITGLLYVFSGVVGIPPQYSKIMVMGIVVLWNFPLYTKVIYK